MKRIISAIMCVIMLLSMAACAQETPNQTSTTTQATVTDTTGTDNREPSVDFTAPLTAVSVPTIVENSSADDGTPLFTYTYQNIFLTYADQDVAAQITLDFHNKFDYAKSYAPTVLAAAQADQPNSADWEPYGYSVIANPMRLDQSILSFYGTKAFYDGAPQSTVTSFSANYDLLTGKSLELKDVLTTAYSAEDLCELIKNGLSQYAIDGILFADYEYIISDMFATNTPVENWYFDTDSLCFFFAPMDIAPNSAGTLFAKIPYSELGNILKDNYFPAEQIELIGDPTITAFTDDAAAKYESITELILEKEGKEYLLHTNGAMRNVRIANGSWSEDGTAFTQEATVFAASTLCSGDALMLQAESLDSLCLTYESGGQIITVNPAALVA